MNLYLARDINVDLVTGDTINVCLIVANSIVDAAAIVRREVAASNSILGTGWAFTAASWTEATKTLTKTSGFTKFDFTAGDNCFVSITAGTNTDKGLYNIATRVGNDAVTLSKSLQNSGGAASSISGYAFRIMEMSDSDNSLAVLSGGKGTFDPYGVGMKFQLTLTGST